MSFLVDFLLNDGEGAASSRTNYYNDHHGSLLSGSERSIELPAVGGSTTAVVEDQAPLVTAQKSRTRLLVGSLILAVMLLGSRAVSITRKEGKENTPLGYRLNPAANAVRPSYRPPPNGTTPLKHQPSSFMPEYTLEAIVQGKGYSPQAKALKWVEQYPHFSRIRRWRKRQLMALATFFYSTGGPSNWSPEAKRDWLSVKLHECNWKGDQLFQPQCSRTRLKGRYQRLELGFNNLRGTLPAELSLLTGLQYVELYGNDQLVGSLPSQFGKLTALSDLSLYNNQLNKAVPSELGKLTRLKVLNLDHNQFTGTLPSQLGTLTSLTRLHLADNRFSGTIPSVLKQLSNLESMYLHGNPRLNGTVSPSLCYFTALQEIWVDCANVKCPCSQCFCADERERPPPELDESGESRYDEEDLEPTTTNEKFSDSLEDENEPEESNAGNKDAMPHLNGVVQEQDKFLVTPTTSKPGT